LWWWDSIPRRTTIRAVPFEELADAVTPATRLVACSHVSWVSGRFAPDLAGIDAPLLLDGAQGVGAVPVDVGAIGCAFYAGSGVTHTGAASAAARCKRPATRAARPPRDASGPLEGPLEVGLVVPGADGRAQEVPSGEVADHAALRARRRQRPEQPGVLLGRRQHLVAGTQRQGGEDAHHALARAGRQRDVVGHGAEEPRIPVAQACAQLRQPFEVRARAALLRRLLDRLDRGARGGRGQRPARARIEVGAAREHREGGA
jgi:selenocysteine lyase/cysteine desulfurase